MVQQPSLSLKTIRNVMGNIMGPTLLIIGPTLRARQLQERRNVMRATLWGPRCLLLGPRFFGWHFQMFGPVVVRVVVIIVVVIVVTAAAATAAAARILHVFPIRVGATPPPYTCTAVQPYSPTGLYSVLLPYIVVQPYSSSSSSDYFTHLFSHRSRSSSTAVQPYCATALQP